MNLIYNVFLITQNKTKKILKVATCQVERDKYHKAQKLILLYQKQAVHFFKKQLNSIKIVS